jgi:MerR family mercuric resistance operon transcriptional regulator
LLAGVSVETIRFYQRRGLLLEPVRPERGYRRYSRQAADEIRFIKRAQALGFTLDEVALLLRPTQADICGTTRKLALAKVELIDAKVTELLAVRSTLAELVEQCDPIDGRNSCAIIEALSGQVPPGPCAPE